jgi:hypothetical protein
MFAWTADEFTVAGSEAVAVLVGVPEEPPLLQNVAEFAAYSKW